MAIFTGVESFRIFDHEGDEEEDVLITDFVDAISTALCIVGAEQEKHVAGGLHIYLFGPCHEGDGQGWDSGKYHPRAGMPGIGKRELYPGHQGK